MMTMLKYSLSALILGVFSSHADEHSGNESPVLVNVLVAYNMPEVFGWIKIRFTLEKLSLSPSKLNILIYTDRNLSG